MAFLQEVISLPLPPSLRQLLLAQGISTVADLDASAQTLVEGKVPAQALTAPRCAHRFCLGPTPPPLRHRHPV